MEEEREINPLEYQIRDGDLDAKIFLPKEEIDVETMKQIRKIITHPGIEHPRIMPDCHRGNGCCVGLTSQLQDKIVPNYVGGDIGCGILTYPIGDFTHNRSEKKLARIEKRIRSAVPMGIRDNYIHEYHRVTNRDLRVLCQRAQEEAYEFAKAYHKRYGKNIMDQMPKYSPEWLQEYCHKVRADYGHVLRSLGTLGGGNHFIEVNQDQRNESWITIHSGSRNFGQKVCRYHQNKINENCKFDYKFFESEMKKVRRKFKDRKKLKEFEDSLREKINQSRHAKYLEGDEAHEYYFDMIFAQQYAQLNRRLMLRLILENLNLLPQDIESLFKEKDEIKDTDYLGFEEERIIESIHNYIDFRDFILRKGSIAAYPDQKCLVSLNMRDGILICQGKGNPDWNFSSAHGAGRVMNRQKAASRLRMRDFEKEMEDVYSTSVVLETLDESPMAYKDTELIKQALGPSVEIIEQLRPMINLKATS